MIDITSQSVLVLDDEPFMLKLLAHQLKVLGFNQIITCDNGVAALEAITAGEPAIGLVLCDLNMPAMDGVEFIRRLVEQNYQGALILASGVETRVLQAAERLVKAHGMTLLGVLQKPVAPQSLQLLIERWLPRPPRNSIGPREVFTAAEIRTGIDGEQFFNYYQPKVGVPGGDLVGVEALARWNHPTGGLVYPDQFIAEAESNELIDALTQRVLKNALADAAAWRGVGLTVPVAINISMNSLNDLDFPDRVAQLAASAGVAAGDVVLEITESRVMKDIRAVLDILTRLCLKGFSLSIDDYGTGHSSLSQLRDLPFSQLKIDRSFVHGAHENSTTRAIYTSSLAMGKELNLDIVAEGVETIDDWEFLKRTGCLIAQGYFIARPMPAEDLPGWLHGWSDRVQRELSNTC